MSKTKTGTTRKGYFGNEWIYTDTGWELKNGYTKEQAEKYKNYVHIEPDGSANYYIKRYKQFIKQYHRKPPDYYLLYGYNNRAINFERIYKYLTPLGQIWFKDVAKGLQQMIEDKLSHNPGIELNSEKFTDFAFLSHESVYMKDGLLKHLPYKDLLLIAIAPGKDIFSWRGLKQIFDITVQLPQTYDLLFMLSNPNFARPDEIIKTFIIYP